MKVSKPWKKLKKSKKDTSRAYAYLQCKDSDILNSLEDNSEKVRAAVGSSLLENSQVSDDCKADFIARLLNDKSLGVRTKMYSRLRDIAKQSPDKVLLYLKQSFLHLESVESKVEALKHLREVIGNQYNDMLVLTTQFLPSTDPWLLNEVNRTCQSAIRSYHEHPMPKVSDEVKKSLVNALKSQYPATILNLREM